jgi:hypothetical protein
MRHVLYYDAIIASQLAVNCFGYVAERYEFCRIVYVVHRGLNSTESYRKSHAPMPGAQASGPQSEARSAASFHLNVSRCALSADIKVRARSSTG